MKLLVHIDDSQYIVVNTRTGGKIVYNKSELEKNNKFRITGLYVKNNQIELATGLYDRCTNGKVTIVCSLNEDKKVIGYIAYLPWKKDVECITRNKALEYAVEPGINNAKLVVTSYGVKYLTGRYGSLPAKYHKQVYMNYYRDKKKKLNNANTDYFKIVRKDIYNIEMRSLAPIKYLQYVGPKGVNQYNLKWWKINNGVVEFLPKPEISILDISNYVETILYNSLPSNYKNVEKEKVSLGCFAQWGLDEVKLGSSLRYIGRESFYGNKLKKVDIPYNVDFIGKSSFESNLIEEINFEKGKLTYLGAKAFKNNLLKEVVIPQTISDIGRECFAGNKNLSKIIFKSDSRLKSLEDYVFQDCSFESIFIPNSVKRVSSLAFKGCKNLREIQLYKDSLLINDLNFNEFIKLNKIRLLLI